MTITEPLTTERFRCAITGDEQTLAENLMILLIHEGVIPRDFAHTAVQGVFGSNGNYHVIKKRGGPSLSYAQVIPREGGYDIELSNYIDTEKRERIRKT